MSPDNALHRAADAAGFDRFAATLIPGGREPVSVWAGASDEIYPASMIKTPLAVAVALAAAQRRLTWTERLAIDPANMTVNDAPSPLAPGASATIAELLHLMLDRSDNVATNVLIDRVDRARANADLTALGFPRTAIRRKVSGALPLIADPAATGRNAHPAAEAAALFAWLARTDLPDARIIRRALAAQFWNTKLSRGLIAGDAFEHKTGDTDEVSHDGGILTLASDKRYAIAVYTERPSNEETDTRFGTFMRVLRAWL